MGNERRRFHAFLNSIVTKGGRTRIEGERPREREKERKRADKINN